MEHHTDKGARGIPLQTVVIAMIAVGALLSLVLIWTVTRTMRGYEALCAATQDYIDCQDAAYDMQWASDYLTEQSRLFVMTGNREHAMLYAGEITVTRTRDAAVETVTGRAVDARIYEQLNSALSLSNTLMEREVYAMRLAAEGLGDDLEQYPELIRQAALSDEDAARPRDAQLELARAMVFDDYYENIKGQITALNKLSLEQLIDAPLAHQTDSSQRVVDLLRLERGLVMLLMLMLLVIAVIIFSLVIRPLRRQIAGIGREEPLDVEGARELRFLARTYNDMLEQSRQTNEKLSYEASHDALTGLYNRAAYDRLRKEWSDQSIALLLVDVDYFKSINDTYGHDVGDRVLRRVAEVLQSSFRGEDMVCRIGGDEFSVIMVHANATLTDLVRSKMMRAAQKLGAPSDDLPRVTLSVGVVFSDQRREGEDLFKLADQALYQTKMKGRNGCTVYQPDAEKTAEN